MSHDLSGNNESPEKIMNKKLPVIIKRNIDLKEFSTFKIGGRADFFANTKSDEEIIDLARFANDSGMNFRVIGMGSNILFSDKGYRGLIIKAGNTGTIINGESVIVGAGDTLSSVVLKAKKAGLSGLEWATGIPGTIGGAIRGNAGAYGHQMGDIIKSVNVLNGKGILREYSNRDCRFGYRWSVFKGSGGIILGAILKLNKEDPIIIQEKTKNIILQRAKNKISYPSIGSIFKSVTNSRDIDLILEKEPHLTNRLFGSWSNKIPAAYLIDKTGLRGKRVGGAKISDYHANYIINRDNATSDDVIILISIIKDKVSDRYNVGLQTEIEIMGD